MILKVWDGDDEQSGWVYFDRIERISIFSHNPVEEGLPCVDYSGGTYTTLKEKFKVATINRTWGQRRTEGEYVMVAFSEGYLLGDDGQTIERL